MHSKNNHSMEFGIAFQDTNYQFQVNRAVVIELSKTGDVIVSISAVDSHRHLLCDVLITGAELQLGIGDEVLVHCPSLQNQRGIVLGRIARYCQATREVPSKPHVSIEASESLTLKCGESSVQLRKDGKVMVLGKDVLTRAKRTARIKGGSVAIN